MAGHSLLFALTEIKHPFTKIIHYDAPDFFPSCSLNSTAIVASRGVTSGHSDLGDLLVAGHKTFAEHVKVESPEGVERITQYTGTKNETDQFKRRYPSGESVFKAGDIKLKREFFLAAEDAFEINPPRYLKWLNTFAHSKLNLEVRRELYKDDSSHEEVIYCAGSINSVWQRSFSDSTLKKTKSAQGAYLEFQNVDYLVSSFSLTLEGHNLIYNKFNKTLLLGSTTHEYNHYLAPVKELEEIYSFMNEHVDLKLPDFSEGFIKVGLREKAPKRLPYILKEGSKYAMGGFYKNGFSLSLEFSRRLCRELLLS